MGAALATARRKLTLALDTRALALSRMATGVMCVVTAWELWDARAVVLDPEGPHPLSLRDALLTDETRPTTWVPTAYAFLPPVAVLAVHVAAAVALAIGLRTELAAALTWYCHHSYITRNTQCTNGGDMLMRSRVFSQILFYTSRFCTSLDEH